MLTLKIPVFNMLVRTLYCCLWEDKIDPCLQQPRIWLTMEKIDFMAPKIGYPTGGNSKCFNFYPLQENDCEFFDCSQIVSIPRLNKGKLLLLSLCEMMYFRDYLVWGRVWIGWKTINKGTKQYVPNGFISSVCDYGFGSGLGFRARGQILWDESSQKTHN